MSRTRTPKYVVEVQGFGTMAWKGRVPTVEGLQKFVMEQVVSTMPGFCNEHIGLAHGISIPGYAEVYLNGEQNAAWPKPLVAWRAPMFMVLPDPKDYPNVAKADWLKEDQRTYSRRSVAMEQAYERSLK
jgi:hypothetical protein